MADLTVHRILWNFIIFITLVFISFAFMVIFKYKNKKLKEDILILERFIIQIFVFLYFILICITKIIDDNFIHLHFTQFVFIPYFVTLNIFNSFIQYENFKQVNDPTFALRSYMTNKKWNFGYETIVMVFVGISIFFVNLVFNNLAEKTEDIYKESCYVFGFCLLFSFATLVFYFRKKNSFKNYSTEIKRNAMIRNFTEFINNILYFLFNLYLVWISISDKINDEVDYDLILIGLYLFFSISLIDSILFSFCIYKSDFYFYTLGNTSFRYFYRMFGNEVYKRPILSVDFSSFNMNGKESSILYFHNNLAYMMEEYLIDTLDNMLNLSLASLYLIFNSFSPDKTPEKIIKTSKSDNEDNDSFSNFRLDGKKKLLEPEFSTGTHFFKVTNKIFKLDRDHFNSDERLARLISPNPEKDSMMISQDNKIINVTIESLYSHEFEDFIYKKGVSVNGLKESLISHLNNSNSNWSSLLNKNCKENSFKKQSKLLLNTSDRLFSFEICSDESVFSNTKSSENFIKLYLNHMQENPKSFLPMIVGVFKLKINNFKEFVIVLTKNIVVQEDPKEYYNYWQLLRLNRCGKTEMLTSSKDRTSTLIKDDILFKNDLKLTLNDFKNFEDILERDMNFLRKMKTKEFSLLVMYYELSQGKSQQNSLEIENAQQRISFGNNNMGAIRISVISPKGNFRRESDEMPNKNNTQNLETFSLLPELNFIQFKENNGFEATFNNFKSVLFFVFDNVFERNGSCQESGDYYYDYVDDIINNFDESALLK